ncbi:hypothetical protein HN51_005905 [Arachis hypogaea]
MLERVQTSNKEYSGSARTGDGSVRRDQVGLVGQNTQLFHQGSLNYISSQDVWCGPGIGLASNHASAFVDCVVARKNASSRRNLDALVESILSKVVEEFEHQIASRGGEQV